MARSSGSTGSPRTGTNHPFVLSVSKDVNGWGLAMAVHVVRQAHHERTGEGSPRTGRGEHERAWNLPFVLSVSKDAERAGSMNGHQPSVRPERVEGCGRAGSMNGHQPSVRPERVEGCGRAGSMNGHQPSVRPEPVEGCERNGREEGLSVSKDANEQGGLRWPVHVVRQAHHERAGGATNGQEGCERKIPQIPLANRPKSPCKSLTTPNPLLYHSLQSFPEQGARPWKHSAQLSQRGLSHDIGEDIYLD